MLAVAAVAAAWPAVAVAGVAPRTPSAASGGGGGGGSSLADGGTIEDGVRETDGKVVISWTAIEAIEAIEVEPTFTG